MSLKKSRTQNKSGMLPDIKKSMDIKSALAKSSSKGIKINTKGISNLATDRDRNGTVSTKISTTKQKVIPAT